MQKASDMMVISLCKGKGQYLRDGQTEKVKLFELTKVLKEKLESVEKFAFLRKPLKPIEEPAKKPIDEKPKEASPQPIERDLSDKESPSKKSNQSTTTVQQTIPVMKQRAKKEAEKNTNKV